MAAIYGHRWSSSYGLATDEAGQLTESANIWRIGLEAVGLEGIRRGLERCIQRADPWPPSLPEFRELCQVTPADLGLPDLETAYRIAASQRPNWESAHPIIWHAKQKAGAYEMTHLPDTEARKRFAGVYQALVQRAMKGETFAYPVTSAPRLEQDKPVEITASGDPKAHLSAMRAMLGQRPPADAPTDAKPEPFHSDPNRRAELQAALEAAMGTRKESA